MTSAQRDAKMSQDLAVGQAMKQHAMLMAQYHQWAYRTLFDQCKNLSEEQYHRDTALFFGSIHGTLNHLLLAEQLWFARFHGESMNITGLDQQMHQTRTPLIKALNEQAQAWIVMIESLPPEAFGQTFSYSNTRGEAMSAIRNNIMAHVFNHGTHHRGQITAAMTTQGLPCPELDLLYYLNPEA